MNFINIKEQMCCWSTVVIIIIIAITVVFGSQRQPSPRFPAPRLSPQQPSSCFVAIDISCFHRHRGI